MRRGAARVVAAQPTGAIPGSTRGVFALGAPRGVFVAFDTVRELLARAEAALPRERQASDAARRAALGVACAVAELARGTDVTADRSPWTVEVPEDVHDLVERTGLPVRDVREGLRILTGAGVVDRVVARTVNRLRLAEEAVAAAPVLAQVAWAPLRAALRAHEASVAPALAVTRAVASRTAGVGADHVGDPVALTQQELAGTTLFGRTAVVAALRSLADIGALTVEARRGTWTECRLGPAVFGVDAYRADPSGTTAAAGEGARHAHVGIAAAAVQEAPLAPVLAGGAGMSMEIGGVLVPLQPGMSVQPPPGAQLVIEIDPDGRRYLRIDAGIRVGPLP